MTEMHFSYAADESPVVILSIRVRMCWAVCRLQVSRKNLRRSACDWIYLPLEICFSISAYCCRRRCRVAETD